MTPIAMHNGVIKFDVTNGATAVTDISSGCIGFSCSLTKNRGGHFTLSNDWEQQTIGGRRANGTIRARVEKESSTTYDYLLDFVMVADESDRRTLELYSPDATTGSIKVSGEAVIEAANNILNVQGGSGEAQVADFNFVFDGTVAIAAVA
jgi:hypothetical protein